MPELDRRWRELGEYIREQRHLGHLSLRRLSQLAGVSNPYLSQIERGQRKPSAEVLQQIARALEISAESLYVRAGILEARTDHDLVAEIRGDPHLTHDQKQTLVRIYESFRLENAHLRQVGQAREAGAALDVGADTDADVAGESDRSRADRPPPGSRGDGVDGARDSARSDEKVADSIDQESVAAH